MHWVIHLVICPVILIPPCYPPGYLPMPPCYPPPPWPSVYQPSYPHSYPSSYLMLPNLINQFIKLSNGDLQCEWIRTFFTNFLLFSKFKWVFVAYFKYLGNFVAFYDFSFGHFFKQKPLLFLWKVFYILHLKMEHRFYMTHSCISNEYLVVCTLKRTWQISSKYAWCTVGVKLPKSAI